MFILRVSNPHGIYVAGFNSQHQTIEVTHIRKLAKEFKSESAASKWAARYEDCGYGLKSGSWKVAQ